MFVDIVASFGDNRQLHRRWWWGPLFGFVAHIASIYKRRSTGGVSCALSQIFVPFGTGSANACDGGRHFRGKALFFCGIKHRAVSAECRHVDVDSYVVGKSDSCLRVCFAFVTELFVGQSALDILDESRAW